MEIIFIILVIYVIFKIRKWWNDDTEENNIYIEDDSEDYGDYYDDTSYYRKSNDNRPKYVVHKKSDPTEKQKDFATLLARKKGLTLDKAARLRFPRTEPEDLNRQHFADLIDWLLD